MPSRRREVRPDGFDADRYEALADKGYDPMEIVDRLDRVDESFSGSYIHDFDIPEEEEEDEPIMRPVFWTSGEDRKADL